MISIGTFTVSDVEPVDYAPTIVTALPTGHLRMVKTYTGEVAGRSITQFSYAFDQETGTGTYVAMESFKGTVAGRRGAFNFVHTASTSGADRSNEYGAIVPLSGTGELAGISGSAALAVDSDGTHRIEFDHQG
jgi:hypothetical protein